MGRVLTRFSIIFALLVLPLLSGCIALPTSSPTAAAPASPTIYMVEEGWHTDIVVAVDELRGQSASLRNYFPGAKYLEFGYGDRYFLMTEATTFDDVVTAMFPGPSALEVTVLDTLPHDRMDDTDVIGFSIPDAGMAKISNFLWDYFEKDSAGKLEPLGVGPVPGSMFYAASRKYNALHTCNSFSAELLHQGGYSINTNGVVFTDQIVKQLFGPRESRPVQAATASPQQAQNP
jgi:uncharacterized protein (TIGR02117 family)